MNRWIWRAVGLAILAEGTVEALPVRESLAMFESGARQAQFCRADLKRGNSGEVSRFQIMPDIWRQYTRSRDFENPEVAWSVASRILDDRSRWFAERRGRNPNAVELYLLWNKPASFAAVGFDPERVRTVYRERAQRFANLRSR